MDGRFAALFVVTSLLNMNKNYCENKCLQENQKQAYISISYGNLVFENQKIGTEAFIRYEDKNQYGPYTPVIGASLSDLGDYWVGFGAVFEEYIPNTHIYYQTHLMPGLYKHKSGPNLGLPLEFRSGVEFGYKTANLLKISLSYDHRSNAEFGHINPGVETLQLRLSLPF